MMAPKGYGSRGSYPRCRCTWDCGGNAPCYGRGHQAPCYHSSPPPPGVPGGMEEPSSVTYVELHPLRWNGESREGKQHQATGKSKPQQSTIPIAYLHNQSYYIDPNLSSVGFQRQHQGELCTSSHACSNSTYNTNNVVLETEGTIGTGLLAGRDILPNEIIAVFSNAIILQDRGLVQEFTNCTSASKPLSRGNEH